MPPAKKEFFLQPNDKVTLRLGYCMLGKSKNGGLEEQEVCPEGGKNRRKSTREHGVSSSNDIFLTMQILEIIKSVEIRSSLHSRGTN